MGRSISNKKVFSTYAFAQKDTQRLCRYTDHWENRLNSYADPDMLIETISDHSSRSKRCTLKIHRMYILDENNVFVKKSSINNQTIRAASLEISNNTLGNYR